MTTDTEFKNSLRDLSTRELTDRIDYYQSFTPRGINYQNQLNLHEAELERRFLAWEICEA